MHRAVPEFVGVADPVRHGPGFASGRHSVLPVDGPGEDHAIASTTADAASFTGKVAGGPPLPVAFTGVKVGPRP